MASEPTDGDHVPSTTEAPDFDDPITYFLDEISYHGRSERTRTAYERVLRQFERFLTGRGVEFTEATRRDCLEWVHTLRSDHAPSTVATYASYVHRSYDYLGEVGGLTDNPMAIVVAEMDESIETDPARRDIPLAEMRSFVLGITHPLDHSLIVTFLKTGIRVGELCNLDCRDIHLDIETEMTGPVRGALDGRPNSLFISAAPERGVSLNGDRRTASNKRQRDTVIPVDEELYRVLKWWFIVRPDPRSSAEPLFVSTREWGRRVTPGMVRSIVTDHAADEGWYHESAGAAENVTPHYFRHFFTTHLRDRAGDRGIVKYLRGDVADDIIDTYTHHWGDRVRESYERHIYSLY